MKHTLLSILMLLAATVSYADDYPVNAGKTAQHTNTSRTLNGISLTSPSTGAQSLTVSQGTNRLLYQDLLSSSFTAQPGEKLTPAVAWTGTWMNSYVYIDFGNDGQFDCSLNADGTPAEGSDVVSYSQYNKLNSLGESLGTANVLPPPAFTLPSDIKPGVYRMRYKIDWDFIDAAGNNSANNDIIKNGGAIVDTRLVIHTDSSNLTIKHGDLNTSTTRVPFGKDIKICIGEDLPESSVVKSVCIRHGYNLDGEATIHGTPQYVDDTLSFLAIRNDILTIPAAMVDGDVMVTYNLAPYNTEIDQIINDTPDNDKQIEGFDLQSVRIAATRTKTFSPTNSGKAYQDFTSSSVVPVLPGNKVTISLTGTHTLGGETPVALTADSAQLYIDLNRDGDFLASLEAFPSATSFTLPEGIAPGYYTARLYLPADGAMIDFTIMAHQASVPLTVETPNGRLVGKTVYGASGTKLTGKGVPEQLAAFRQCAFNALPLVTGYSAQEAEITITRPDGTKSQYHTNLSKPSYAFTLLADSIYGSVNIKVDFTLGTSTSASQRQAVLTEEFDSETINDDLWRTSTRYSAAWNRFIVDDPRVAYIEDGNLVCRCFANPGDISGFSGQMVSGAKETQGHFTFNHGYIEARILTHPHSGNFPAFWLMPADQSDGWPTCGEIDIWETINTESRAYNTVHSHWTYDLGNGGNGGNRACDHNGQWHIFGLLKEANKLTWYLDGDQVFTYTKSTNESQLSQGQWPFDKPFYIILNQSVGNGSWAAGPDASYVYETKFDWVRVYQTAQEAQDDGNEPTGIADATQTPTQVHTDNNIYDLNGRRLVQPTKGQFYIQHGKVHLAR